MAIVAQIGARRKIVDVVPAPVRNCAQGRGDKKINPPCT